MTNYHERLNSLINDLKKDIIQQERDQGLADNIIVGLKEELQDIRDRYEYVLQKR